MPIHALTAADAGSYPAEPALARLCQLLDVPPPRPALADLTPDHLAGWKPLIERCVFDEAARAEELAVLLIAVAEASSDPAMIGLAEWTAGNVYFLLDRPLAALAHFGQAETAYRSRGDLLAVARLSVGKVSALDKAGLYEDALRCGLEAEPILTASADPADGRRLMGLYNGIGISSEHLGRFTEALAAYERKWRWWRERAGDAARVKTARALVNIGVVNTRLGQYTEAADAFSQAHQTLTGLPTDGRILADIARIDMNLAWLAVLRRSPLDVVGAAFAQARTSRASIDPEDASTDLALLDLFQAEWLVETGQGMVIDRTIIEALTARLLAAGLAFETTRAELLLGQLAFVAGDLGAALAKFAETASAAARRGDHEGVYLAGVHRARAHRSAGEVGAAQATLEAVLTDVEQVRSRLMADEYRAGYLEDKLIAYRELAALYLADGDTPRALRTIERAKARSLAELLDARHVGQSSGTFPDAQSASLVAEHDALQTQLSCIEEGDAERRRPLEKLIVALRRQITQATPRFVSAQGAIIPSIAEVCELLPDDTLLLAYAAVSDGVVVFPFDRGGSVGPPVPVGPLVRSDRLRLDLARIASVAGLPRETGQRWAPQQIRSAQMPLGTWFEQYLGPLRAKLDRYARLLIVPDHLLTLLPFSALYDRRSGRYLAQSHELLVAPSLTTWVLLAGQEAPTSGPPLAVGFSSGGRLGRAVDEALAVAAHFPGTELLVEEMATRANFARAARDAGLIHIATHGLYRADTPAFSYLELADGRLEAFNIARLELNAAAVVLSACETGVGYLTGNELMGLVRAFLHAGTRSVLATQWAVDDTATATLITSFAEHLSAGKSAARALHETQKLWIAEHFVGNSPALLAHPYYWGGLTLVGADCML